MIHKKSYLFTSALKIDTLTKGQEVGADVRVIDLEDAVGDDYKQEARTKAKDFLKTKPNGVIGLRINNIRSIFGLKDIICISEFNYKPNIIFLPKIQEAEEIRILKDCLYKNESTVPLIFPLIETTGAILNINEIASISDGLLFGAADYATDIDVEITWENLLYARQLMVAATHRYNIPCLESTSFAVDDKEKIEKDCLLARKIGYTAMAAIHPIQISIIKRIFSPSAQEIEEAKIIIEQHKKNKNFNIHNGVIVAPPFIRKARKILKKANINE